MADKDTITYYQHKVFTRAQGILDTCVIKRVGYKWGKNEDGRRLLGLVLEKDTKAEAIDKALEYMQAAFRKASAYKGPMAEFKDRPGVQMPTIMVEFKEADNG